MQETRILPEVAEEGQPLESMLEAVVATEAGRQLPESASGEGHAPRATWWQTTPPERRAGERHYSWLENYMEWLARKEARADYHALLEREFSSLKG